MSRTFRSYVGLGSPAVNRSGREHFTLVGPIETRLTLTAFVGPASNNRNSVQFTLGTPGRDYVGLHSSKVEAVMNALQNRVAVKAEGEGNATPFRIRPTEKDDYEMLISLGVPDRNDETEYGSYIALTETQVEDMAEALRDRLEGKDWTSATTWESFYRLDEDGEKTEMYEPGVTMEEYEREQEQEVA